MLISLVFGMSAQLHSTSDLRVVLYTEHWSSDQLDHSDSVTKRPSYFDNYGHWQYCLRPTSSLLNTNCQQILKSTKLISYKQQYVCINHWVGIMTKDSIQIKSEAFEGLILYFIINLIWKIVPIPSILTSTWSRTID